MTNDLNNDSLTEVFTMKEIWTLEFTFFQQRASKDNKFCFEDFLMEMRVVKTVVTVAKQIKKTESAYYTTQIFEESRTRELKCGKT